MRNRLKRLWCRLMHWDALKTEQVQGFKWRKRCLECGEKFPFEPREM